MNFSGIEAFLTIVQYNGLGRAAEQLHLTQPSISKRLQLLEDELGVSLVERGRGTRGIQLTIAGEAFLEIAERWASLHRETQLFSMKAQRPSLRIGSVAAIEYELLNEVYRQLYAIEPPIQITLHTGTSRELCEQINRRELDVAFTRQVVNGAHFVSKELYAHAMVGLCLTGSPLAGRVGVNIHDLKGEYEIFARSDENYQSWHDSHWGVDTPGRVVVSTIHLLQQLLIRPEQWALVPHGVAVVACSGKELASFTLHEATPLRHCYQITPRYPRGEARLALAQLEMILKKGIEKMGYVMNH